MLYLISPDSSEAGTLETLPRTEGMILMKNDQILNAEFEFHGDDKICITSEASLDTVKEKLNDPSKRKAIEALKDKHIFREILAGIYPGHQYKKIAFDDIQNLTVDKKTILKPVKGCFGTAVKTIDHDSDLTELSREIQNEIQINAKVLSDGVLTHNEFLVEDHVDGEEYAVDMFFDGNGAPHIVNIYHHPMPRVKSYLHMVYYTGREVFDALYEKAMVFFQKLNGILKVKNFVMHAEFKYNGDLFPIEINAMRFGGMGLGNMIYHAVGVDPYDCFNKGISPDWENIWRKHPDDKFAFFIAYNGTGVDKSLYEPDIKKLKSEFTEILHEQIFDYQTQLAFGIFCIKETDENLKKLLDIEFNDYFNPVRGQVS